jgi:hypothetical protein
MDTVCRVGQQLDFHEDHCLEIKELDDKLSRLKGKASRVAIYNLWMRIYELLPDTKIGTWAIRHSRTKVYMVKMSMAESDI